MNLKLSSIYQNLLSICQILSSVYQFHPLFIKIYPLFSKYYPLSIKIYLLSSRFFPPFIKISPISMKMTKDLPLTRGLHRQTFLEAGLIKLSLMSSTITVRTSVVDIPPASDNHTCTSSRLCSSLSTEPVVHTSAPPRPLSRSCRRERTRGEIQLVICVISCGFLSFFIFFGFMEGQPFICAFDSVHVYMYIRKYVCI